MLSVLAGFHAWQHCRQRVMCWWVRCSSSLQTTPYVPVFRGKNKHLDVTTYSQSKLFAILAVKVRASPQFQCNVRWSCVTNAHPCQRGDTSQIGPATGHALPVQMPWDDGRLQLVHC
jgi:hypothetical protein